MSKIDKLIKDYSGHTFSSGGETGSDYKTFEKKYKNILKEIADNINANLIDFSKNHYTFSAFIERDDSFAYISISDVRHFNNEWKDNILVRTAKYANDFSGGQNSFTNLKKLEQKIDNTLK